MACNTNIFDSSDENQESRHCEGKQHIKKFVPPKKKRKRHKIYHFGDTSGDPIILTSSSYSKKISKTTSLLEFKKSRSRQVKTSRSYINRNEINQPYNCRVIANDVTKSHCTRYTNPFVNFRQPVMWHVYRCQFDSPEQNCCCSCNSDAMFEVMKSLYDCYKRKNCSNCNCILCCHLPREERKFGEIRKAITGLETASIQEKKDKMKMILTEIAGKSAANKEKVLKEMALKGVPLPDGKTASEQNMINKIRREVGLPPMPTTDANKQKYNDAILNDQIAPLEEKTPEGKEKILRATIDLGLLLPKGRTISEKALINKVKATSKSKEARASLKHLVKSDEAQKETKLPTFKAKILSEKLRKAKAEGLLTPITRKSPEQQEKIIKGLAKLGIPLPEGKTSSEKKMINKVQKDMGLPPAPTTTAMKKKYDKAHANGIITPLEGKTHAQKEKILKALTQAGLLLPEGRTQSEKALVKKVKDETGPVPPALKQKERKVFCGCSTEKALKKKDSDPVVKIPSEKLRKAKAEGLIIPLAGKTSEQKEKILKVLTKMGLQLPEGKSPSEKMLIEKVQKDMGLPLTPKTSAMRHKYNKAFADGIITPLEGKTHAQKENILKAITQAGLPLPEGRTASEKALVKKLKDETGPVPSALKQKERKVFCGCFTEKALVKKDSGPVLKIPSEKLRKAKAEGLITPLKGKTPEQQEKILKGLTRLGIPLPESKTTSEKKLIDKVRKDVGLPPSPTTAAMKIRYNKAHADGIITPLEGKTPAQQEKILKGLAQADIPLPEGRTASEKALVKKIKDATGSIPPALKQIERKVFCECSTEKALVKKVKTESGYIAPPTSTTTEKKDETALIPPEAKAAKISAEKLRKAKAAGLITPITGKTPDYQEKILKGLAQHGIPLPEGKTSLEKKLIDKVRKDVGLPPSPRTSAMKTKYDKAQADGLITPLEGKSLAQKEKILKGIAQAGLPLPEGRTPSEKALVKKLKTVTSAVTPADKAAKLHSEKLRKAKAVGLFTPLTGKTPEQKEKILRDAAKNKILLPEPKTASEKNIMDKVRKELGLPPPPTPSTKSKMLKAHLVGLITPLEGKTTKQKENIIKGLLKAGVPLPEGRTTSEKKLIDRVKKELGAPASAIPTVKSSVLKKAKQQGFLTPLKGKSNEQKEQILKGLASLGIPLPEGETVSEKKLIDKVKKALQTPKTLEQKEKILREVAMRGLPFPVAKTDSDRKLINKVRADLGMPPEPKTLTEQKNYNKALAKRQVIPLEGKSKVEKEKILKILHNQGVELPVGRTKSEKELIAKIRAERPVVTPITPLEGKTSQQKENIIKGLLKAGLPLPEGRTTSEKKLIDRVKKEIGASPSAVPAVKSSVLRKAKQQGLLTPLKGKSNEQKEQVLKGLASLGIPLPEGETVSEKKLIDKVKKALQTPKALEQKELILREVAMRGLPFPVAKTDSDRKLINKVRADLGMPPEPKTLSEQKNYNKALAKGQVIPLEGKSKVEKEKILKILQDQGVELPVGRTTSEKELIAKIRAERPVVTSKKARIEDTLQKRSAGIAAEGLTDEFEEIKKTCERGCGCDRKKIRFKDSYLKIKVTAPDLSSICPCPDECIPGVKGGVFVDNEGITVTVGSAIGCPSFFKQNVKNAIKRTTSCFHLNQNIYSCKCNIDFNTKQSQSKLNLYNKHAETKQLKKTKATRISLEKDNLINTITNLNYNESCESTNINDHGDLKEIYENKTKFKLKNIDILSSSSFISLTPDICDATSDSNQGSALSILKTESSLCYSSTPSNNVETISIISLHSSEIIPTSSHYLCYPDSLSSGLDEDDSEYLTNKFVCIAEDKNQCLYDTELVPRSTIIDRKHVDGITYKRDLFDFKVTQHNDLNKDKEKVVRNECKPIIIINDLHRDSCDVLRIVENIMSQRDDSISTTSSLFVMVPTTDEEDDNSDNVSESSSSTICIKLSDKFFWGNNIPQNVQYHPSVFTGIYFRKRGKCDVVHSRTVDSLRSATSANGSKALSAIPRHRIIADTTETVKNGTVQFSMDTSQDRPCCCQSQTFSNIFTEVFNPMMLSQGLDPIDSRNSKTYNLTGQPSVIYQCQTPSKSICNDTLNCETGTENPCQENVSKGQLKFEIKSKVQSTGLSQPQPLQCPPKMDEEKGSYKGYSEKETKTRTPGPFSKPVYIQSTGCGPSTCEHATPPAPVKLAISLLEPCTGCPTPIREEKKVDSCMCSGKEKKVQIPESCPWEAIRPPSPTLLSNTLLPGNPPCYCGKKLNKKPKKKTKHKWSKSHKCECPSYTFPSSPSFTENTVYCEPSVCDLKKFEIEKIRKIREERKIQTDMTQATSGFKLKLNKKTKLGYGCIETDMSFDDALRFFEEHPDFPSGVCYVDEGCYCSKELLQQIGQAVDFHQEVSDETTGKKGRKKKKKKLADCECPIDIIDTGLKDEDEPKGIKVHMEGKGTESTGLTGICCFDMIQDAPPQFQTTDVDYYKIG